MNSFGASVRVCVYRCFANDAVEAPSLMKTWNSSSAFTCMDSAEQASIGHHGKRRTMFDGGLRFRGAGSLLFQNQHMHQTKSLMMLNYYTRELRAKQSAMAQWIGRAGKGEVAWAGLRFRAEGPAVAIKNDNPGPKEGYRRHGCSPSRYGARAIGHQNY